MKHIIISCVALFCGFFSMAQDVVLDEILAKVGHNILLKSELDYEIEQAKKSFTGNDADLECVVFRQLLVKEMLLHQAKLDSIPVTDENVTADLDNKLRFYINQAGGVDELEEYLGMSLVEYKEQMRPLIKEQLLVKEMRRNLTGSMSASPKEVREYFNSLPADSLPVYGAEIELGQIVAKPEVSEAAKKVAYEKIKKLKERLEKGEDFSILASVWSEDPGSSLNGGVLPEFGRRQMVPEFERTAFGLKAGELSDIIETEYGYHILQSIYRKGEKVKVRHILIKPKLDEKDLLSLKMKLDTVVTELRSGKLDFCAAVNKYSSDNRTKNNCGFFSDPNTGLRSLEMSGFEPDVVADIKNLSVGDYSSPKLIRIYDGSSAYRILFLKGEKLPHKADLEKDYQRIQLLALEHKKNLALEKWVKEASKNMFIEISAPYNNCTAIKTLLN